MGTSTQVILIGCMATRVYFWTEVAKFSRIKGYGAIKLL